MSAVLLTVLVIALMVFVLFSRVGASERDVAWISGSAAPPPARAEVFGRYLTRHRRHRLAGALFGAVLAVVVGIRFSGTVTLGIGGDGSPLGDILYCAVAGVVLGTLSAESFRLTGSGSTARTASLTERRRTLRPELHMLGRVLALASVAVSAAVAATGNGLSALWIALIGGLVMLVADATARAIAGRPQPLMSDEAREVDARMRDFAAASIAHLYLAVAVLTAGWVVSETDGLGSGAVDLARFVVVVGALVWAIVLLRRASPRPHRSWSGVGG